jgi:hypothetical protein
MSITVKYLVRLKGVVLWLWWDLLHAHKLEEAWLRYWCFQTQKPTPPNTAQKPMSWANPTKPARLEIRFSGDCSGNKLFRAYGSHCSLSLAASRHSWLSLWEFCLELFTIQPKLLPIHKPAGTIHKLAGTMYKLAGTASKLVGTFYKNWPELCIIWAELACKLAWLHTGPRYV